MGTANGDDIGAAADRGAPNIGAEYEIAIFDKDGNEKRRFGGKANCFVKGFMDYIWHLSRNGTNNAEFAMLQTGFVNTSGGTVTTLLASVLPHNSKPNGGARAIAAENFVGNGIVFGRDATPVTLADYNVGGLVSTSELTYDACLVTPVSVNGNVMTLEVTRGVANAGSVPVTGICSIALYLRGSYVTSLYFMILRDVIPVFDLAPGESAIGIYRMIFNGGS